jgi:predicted helicase
VICHNLRQKDFASARFNHRKRVLAAPVQILVAFVMPTLTLKPAHKVVSAYYDNLAKFAKLGIKHETAVRSAFQELLEHCARQFDWKLVPEYRIKRRGQADASADGALLDNYGLNHGLWEAKDSADDLEKEIKNKFSIGYPKQNILFWQPDRAVLYQNGEIHFEADLKNADDLVKILTLFLEFAPPAIAEWEKAVEEFRDKVPQIGASLKTLIEKERQTNKKFIAAFEDFCSLCRGSLNPNISVEAVEEMIIQHILTERIFRKIFAYADFIARNVIAQEIEKVITALNSRVFSRDDFSKSLEHFYGAIENAAATISDFTEKQTFLNTVYERFFQGFCVKVADTHGIVYTPQPLVNFMVASAEQILKKEFGKSLADKEVHILDPFTGTGNFIVNIMRHIPKSALPHKYASELHCNEIMLLPYYVASMNIEHAYLEATGQYESFEGICLVDTFQTVEKAQTELSFFNEKNSARVNRQKKAPIRVVIANPPYNAWQADENDNNKNRKYEELDRRVRVTYADDSIATLKNSLGDPYIKAIRWASDRIGETGIVCFVTNNGYVEGIACDGMRKHLAKDFDLIYVLDLGGNVRKNPKLSGTTHNVFGIQVGVSISLFVRLPKTPDAKRNATIRYYAVTTDWRKEEKYQFLEKKISVENVKWTSLKPNQRGNWLTKPTDDEFADFISVANKAGKDRTGNAVLFSECLPGISTMRDATVYDFNAKHLGKRIKAFCESFNGEVIRYEAAGKPKNIDNFVDYTKLKWSSTLKLHLARASKAIYEEKKITESLYRPFAKRYLYYDEILNDRPSGYAQLFPNKKAKIENRLICVNLTSERPFVALATNLIPERVSTAGFGSSSFSLPLYTYSEDGKHKQDNVTPKARTLFQIFYADDTITQADIFHYVYAVLHHPIYRTRFAENLKRDLPRIPFVGITAGEKNAGFFPLAAVEKMQGDAKPDHNPKVSAKFFHAFAAAGKQLADLHVNYESAREFKLKRIENKEVKLDWRVEAMKLTKDKSGIVYNDFLTLAGIPPEVFDYKLGNRSALEWVIDQYCVTRDEKGNIASDPNRMDDEQYIVRLIGQVVTVSLDTIKIVKSLPELKSN